MSSLKRLSLLVGALASAISAAVVGYAVGPAWQAAGGGGADILLAASLVGVIVGGFLWLVAGSFDHELERAHAVIRAFVEGDPVATAAPLRWRFGLASLIELVQESQTRMHGRVTELTVSRRAMDVQLCSIETRRHHLEAVLNTIHEAVIVTDALDEIVLANEAATRMLRADLAGALRRPADEAIPDPSLVRMIRDTREGGRSVPRLLRRMQHHIARGGDSNVVEVTMQCLGGTTFTDDEAERAPAGCGGVVTVLRDVTREVASAERRGDFVASVSHELRTPLSSIKGCLEMLMDGEAAEPEIRTEFYHIIQTETNRLSRLVDNILSISRIESGLVRSAPRGMPLTDLLNDAVNAVRPQARGKDVELSRWDGAGVATCAVLADRDMVHDVLLNLLNNAVKFTPAGGRISVGADLEPETGFVRVAVTDNGVGIPAEALPHLFQKFYRVPDHAHLGKGTGLGLNLVKHVIETVHGGSVGVTSELGQGSTFTFTLPLAENTNRNRSIPETREVTAGFAGEGRS